jgi:hypothetical protein
MSKKPAQKKKAGRPPILGNGEPAFLGLRLSSSLVEAIDTWAKNLAIKRSDAVRQLIALGLKAEGTVSRAEAGM